MADLDVLSVTVIPSGDQIDVVLAGNHLGGTYADGFDAPYDTPGANSKVTLTVTSLGYTGGILGTRVRTVYGTKWARTPATSYSVAGSYTTGTFQEGETVTQAVTGATGVVVIPGASGPTLFIHTVTGTPNTTDVWTGGTSTATFTPTAAPVDYVNGPREFFDGTNTRVRLWLTRDIYAKDDAGAAFPTASGVDITYDIKSGFYTHAATPNNAGTGTVTNGSTLAYPKVCSNWTWPGYQLFGATWEMRCFAAGPHPHNGDMGIDRVVFSMAEGANMETATSTAPEIDPAMTNDAKPVIEFVGRGSSTTLTQAAVCNGNYIAYPTIGDADSILDTSTGTADPTPLFGPKKMLCDKTGTYPKTYARVSTTGSDAGANTVYDSSVYDGATAYEFATIGKAASAIAAHNNTTHGRNDVGAGVIHLDAGNYAWLGSTNTYGTTPNTWITIKPNTGVAAFDPKITSASGNGDISDRIKLESLDITVTTANTFTNVNAIWLHKCRINSTGTGLFNTTAGVWWLTQCAVPHFAQGLRPVSTNNCPCALVRGCDLEGFKHTILAYTSVGNKRSTRYTPTTGLFVTEINGQTAPHADNFIIAFNEIKGWETGVGLLALECGRYVGAKTRGAIIQNLFENCSGSGALADIASSDSITTNTPIEGLLIWHNTFLGQRVFVGYNDAGTLTKYRRHWSILNNIWDRWANKGDLFAPQNAARVGAWQIANSVNASGNALVQNQQSVPGSFYAEYPGIASYQPPTTDTGATNWAVFVDPKRFDGTTEGAGGGDYHLDLASPAIGLPIVRAVPSDLDGDSRTAANNDAGAYAHAVAPTITDQPDSASKAEGESVTFTVVATGIPDPTYQWRKDGVAIPGETGTSLTINNLQAGDAGDYDVVVTNDAGSVTSDVAVLTVQGTVSTGCDIQALLTDGKCFYGLPPSALEVAKVQLWCNIAQSLP